MNILLIYKSKSGFTKKYANWISDEINCNLVSYKNIPSSISTYDYVIYGSRVYSGKVDGLKKIKAMFNSDTISKLVVYATGGTPFEAKDVISSIWNNSLSSEELKVIPHFYMQAGLDYNKMNITDRFIMKTLSRILDKKNNKTSAESGCENAIKSSYDISSKDHILPLIEYLRKENK